MASIRQRLHVWAHDSRATSERGRRKRLIWLLALVLPIVLVAASAVALASTRGSNAASKATTVQLEFAPGPPQPADLFMQSVATEDGNLGWHQLCPDIQARLPLDSLVQQTDAMRAQAAQAGVRLTVQSLGTRPQQGGWQMHTYRMTAHWASGATRQWTYNVLTQPSGCVEDVQGA